MGQEPGTRRGDRHLLLDHLRRHLPAVREDRGERRRPPPALRRADRRRPTPRATPATSAGTSRSSSSRPTARSWPASRPQVEPEAPELVEAIEGQLPADGRRPGHRSAVSASRPATLRGGGTAPMHRRSCGSSSIARSARSGWRTRPSRRDERKPTDMTTFDALGVAGDLVAALAERGITSPFPIQALTIADALAGRDVCGKAKTGSGKTLAFGLPILQRVDQGRAAAGPRALVLVPTRELAIQVRDELAPLGEVRGRQRRRRLRRRRHGQADQGARARASTIVVATPGRMIDLLDREATSTSPTSSTVVHRRGRPHGRHGLPAPGRVDPAPHRPREHQTLLFSATLDGVVAGPDRPLPDRSGPPRGRVARRSPSRRWRTASCWSTRWTR